ncbi:YjfB family protein [Paenibacillus cremeus]|uniref:Putative motility protein n=1 Tax=Paenibacillus cremeus TaxID=2163881 RepID=A0A559K8I4_9BACL|nr:YjfB family protein [Paenibacillus cremeus]TVY08427.1 putative motility protein [Paenibacillus cremeus]
MDIPALSMAMSQASLLQDANLSVMKMAMDTAKTNAANMTEMLSQTSAMQQSVQPHLGSHIDVRV